jgi:CHC2 zinc finger
LGNKRTQEEGGMSDRRPPDSREWNDLVEQARHVDMVWLVERYGVKLRKVGRFAYEYVGPCPVCGTGTDRFSIKPNGRLFNCRVCARGGKGAIDLLMFLADVDFATAVRELTGTLSGELRVKSPQAEARDKQRQQEQADYEAAQHAKARKLWRGHKPAAGSLVETYLHARGYHFPIPLTIGFLPASEKYPPTMISAFALPNLDRPGVLGPPRDVQSVHLTALLPDGSDRVRAEGAKRIIGRPLARPLVMSVIADDNILCISEGVESALAFAAARYGSWAAGSAPHLPALAQTIPEHIDTVVIEQHDDEAGIRNTKRLIERLHEREQEKRESEQRQGVRPSRPMKIRIFGDRG